MFINRHICYFKKRIYALKSTYIVCTYIGIKPTYTFPIWAYTDNIYGTKNNIYKPTYTDRNQHMLVTKMHVYVRINRTYTCACAHIGVLTSHIRSNICHVYVHHTLIYVCKLQHIYVQHVAYTCLLEDTIYAKLLHAYVPIMTYMCISRARICAVISIYQSAYMLK